MPNRNGTGPERKGPKTGRGLGPCDNGTPKRGVRGKGLGLRKNAVNNKKKDDKNN